MTDVDAHEWIDALHHHFGVNSLPVLVAAEILLGDRSNATAVAESIRERGLKVEDVQMMVTTEADVAEAVGLLQIAGFLQSVAAVGCTDCETTPEGCEEHMMVLRLP